MHYLLFAAVMIYKIEQHSYFAAACARAIRITEKADGWERLLCGLTTELLTTSH